MQIWLEFSHTFLYHRKILSLNFDEKVLVHVQKGNFISFIPEVNY